MASERWEYPDSTLHRVVDGDTLYATVRRVITLSLQITAPADDFGFHVLTEASSATFEIPRVRTARQKFRLNRIATAPGVTPSGLGAAFRLAGLLEPSPFHLTSVRPYKFGDEWMAEIVLADGRNVSDLLVEEQWAVYWDGRGRQPLPPWPRSL